MDENKEKVEKETTIVEPVKLKRGRKPKNLTTIENIVKNENNTNLNQENNNNIIISIQEEYKEDVFNNLSLNQENNLIEEQKPGIKKRGRKPKGGKIIQQLTQTNNNKETKPNIILHLKCSLKDLVNNNLLGNSLDSFIFKSNNNDLSYDIVNKNNNSIIENNLKSSSCYTNTLVNNDEEEEEDTYYNDNYNQNKDNDIRIIWNKLKQLQHNLHVNNISDKKSACFWCTYDFDNPPIYIPKHFIKESYHVYGCFCSPECATAYLMEENIDSSSKFERYFLINHIYSKIYDYKKSIKPAPSPQYMLEKFYGNLSIQEYRALLRNERLFLIVDKPLTRILPELHEDNDDFIINNKIIPSNTYHIKKKLQSRKQNKNNILEQRIFQMQI
jgi:hypothetical protein